MFTYIRLSDSDCSYKNQISADFEAKLKSSPLYMLAFNKIFVVFVSLFYISENWQKWKQKYR